VGAANSTLISLEVCICSLVLDSFTKDMLKTILACIINIVIGLVSVNRP
jgi:hypothetical protein